MGNRRFAQLATSDEEEDEPRPLRRRRRRRRRRHSSDSDEEHRRRGKRGKIQFENDDDDDDEGEKEEEEQRGHRGKKRKKEAREEDPSRSGAEEDPEEEDDQEEAKPVGDVVRVSGKGRGTRKHYEAFEYDGLRYELEDPVLLVPEEQNQKPYVAIIKDISETREGSVMVTGQWFYRPEEAEKKGGGNWESSDTRELFYSFHRDEVPAESVMHKCVAHFIPLHKQIPNRKQHPGFIVQKVYDTDQRRLFLLTDKDYEDNKQHEIDLLVQKTLSLVGDLPDIESEDAPTEQEDRSKNKRLLRRKNMMPLNVSKDDGGSTKSGQALRVETPGSCNSDASEYYRKYNRILASFNSLTGETSRDRWLERLLESIQFICTSVDAGSDSKENGATDAKPETSKPANGIQDKSQNLRASFIWPDAAVPAVAALEKAGHESLSSDFQKYNQKMRSLHFNLKNNRVLAQRLLKGELEPSKLLNMSPTELKEGLTAEEISRREPEELARVQMTDARCKRCMEKKVGVVEIIQTGRGDRYQLECSGCGNTWFASRDEVSTLTIEGATSTKSVGTAPWATAKFEDVEKKMVSPRDPSASETLKKATEPYVPVLEKQKSFGKPRSEENPSTSAAS